MSDTTDTGPVLAADGTPLKRSLNKALRRQKLQALALIAPLLLFVLITFILPIGDMLFRSVENQIVADTLPLTVEALEDWDYADGATPREPVFTALAADLQVAAAAKRHTRVGQRLNYEYSGISSLFRKSGRGVSNWDLEADAPFREKFLDIDEDWADIEIWRTIQAYSGEYTDGYFLAAVDAEKTGDGARLKPSDERLYGLLFFRTLMMSIAITLMCLLLGYPVAWLLANIKNSNANLLMILVLLPFWTSLLVRTSAWKVLLQNQGVINDILVALHLVSDDGRLQLINNQIGTIIAMTHILLPFMILPLFSVMKTIQPTYLRAAKSLGATNWTAFWRVYFPQSIPGIGAGSILVFILSIGYYITPALVGGRTGTFISNRIAYHISNSGNWGLAAALGSILLVAVLILYWVYDRMVGIDNVKLG